MCVAIIMEPGAELSLEEVQKMGKANGDGVGFAWADGESVQWYKTVVYNPEKIVYHINARKDYFRLVHFRLSTAGGVRAELCHPFEVGHLASNDAAGSTENQVLIHNGHWGRWSDVFDIMKGENILPDAGPWSDTRLMAMLASYDPEWLDTVGGRVATLDKEGNVRMWGDWHDLRPGIKVSNKVWENHNYSFKRSGRDRDWQGWGWTAENWRDYDKAKEDEKKRKEEETKKLLSGDEKESNGTQGKSQEPGKEGNEEAKGAIRLGDGRGDGAVSSLSTQEKGEDGGRDSEGNRQGGEVHVPMGKVQRQTVNGVKKLILDHTPWQNPGNKRWYWIDPQDPYHAGKPGKVKIKELSEARARSVMGQIAVAAAQSEQ